MGKVLWLHSLLLFLNIIVSLEIGSIMLNSFFKLEIEMCEMEKCVLPFCCVHITVMKVREACLLVCFLLWPWFNLLGQCF